MTQVGVALDDAALAIASGAAAPVVAPSIVDAGRGQRATAGRPAAASVRTHPAAASSRHWFDLANGRPPSQESLAIARAELAYRLGEAANATTDAGEPLPGGPAVAIVAVPAAFDGAALARVLAIARSVALPVESFVDAAALAAAALGLAEGAVIVLELGLHHFAATRVDVDGREARRRSTRVRTRGGLVALQESWLQLVSEAMVLKTRFDPLHDAATEQRLYDQLPAVAAQAARGGSAAIGLAVGSGEGALRHEVVLSRDQFAARGEALYGDLVAMIHELRSAGAPVTLLAPARLATLPGLREALAAEFQGCEMLLVPEGFVARAAACLPVQNAAPAAGAVPLRRGLARFDAPLGATDGPVVGPVVGEWLGGGEGAPLELPTHLLWSGSALPLAGAAIEIGRMPAAGGIVLAEGLAGVSRLHCTVRDDAGSIVLVDHSRHGSFVNGERVAGRARLRAGDRVRIGDPGVELALISVGARHGTPQG